MKIALLGYGKMGKEIETIALERNHQVVLKINRENSQELNPSILKQADVAIEFSTPQAVLGHIRHCFEADVPLVVGATGWYEKFDTIKADCMEKNQALFYATNFSLGVHLFLKINEQMAKLMKHFPDYELSMQEIHHIHKLDKPSGTAITTAERILAQYPMKQAWSISEKTADNLYIDVLRKEEVPGTHTVCYTSAVDEISVTHKAFNRKGFALGAVLAAEFIQHKKGIYSMSDLLES